MKRRLFSHSPPPTPHTPLPVTMTTRALARPLRPHLRRLADFHQCAAGTAWRAGACRARADRGGGVVARRQDVVDKHPAGGAGGLAHRRLHVVSPRPPLRISNPAYPLPHL